MVRDYITDLKQEFQGYGRTKLLKDILAGLTVTAVALPLALAFGVSSGADAAAGLITAIIAGIVIGAFSGAYYQISGPTGAMAAILISVIANYQMEGVFVATLMAGVILVLAGLFHLGTLTLFIPGPVITGFTSGIAIIIALGQFDSFFGVHSEGETAIARLLSYRELGFDPNVSAIGVGLFVILFMLLFPRKWTRFVPSSLLSILLTTIVCFAAGIDVETVGEIPRTLIPAGRLHFGDLNLSSMFDLLAPAVSIALLGMIESLLCGSSAGRMTGVRLNNDQELVAQGIGNILVPFFGGIPATAAIARTSVAIRSGAVTRLTGIVHAVGLLLSMFLLAPFMSRIPLSALAGVLIVTAWRMNEWNTIHYIFSRRFKGAILKFSATMLATVVFDLVVAILIGVFIGLVLLVHRLAEIEINYEKVDIERLGIHDEELSRRYQKAYVVYITGPLIFANTTSLEQILKKIPGDCDRLLLSMRGVSHIDVSGAQSLLEMLKSFKEKGGSVLLCGVPNGTMESMRRAGIYEMVGQDRFYWSVERAILDHPY